MRDMIKLFKPFKYAMNGLKLCFKTQQNFKVHLLLAMIALIAGTFLQINLWQWIVVTICISMVLAAELFNSAIERICDHVNPSYHPQIKLIKDMSAAAVLVIAIMSLMAGLLIFIPAFIHSVKS
jgi:diacylglycerol kinase